jgi:hypothetical protein
MLEIVVLKEAMEVSSEHLVVRAQKKQPINELLL